MAAAKDQPLDQPKRKRGRGKPFEKGRSGNPSGLPKRVLPLGPPEGLVSRPEETQLEAMRWVITNPADETHLQWQMRQWLLADRDKFMGAKVTLERAMGPGDPPLPGSGGENSRSSGSTTGPSALAGPKVQLPDLGTEACLGLIEELMERYGEKRP